MKHICGKIISVVLVVMLFLTVAPMSIESLAAEYSGECGENLTWSLNTETGELVVSGTGEMDDYTSTAAIPWCPSNALIKKVIIEDGVTSVGNFAFGDCENIESVVIGSDVISIGKYAFYCCFSLTDVSIGDNVKNIDGYAFEFCYNLENITIPDGVETIGKYTFANCESLVDIVFGDGLNTIDAFAFEGCVGLKNIVIPKGITTISNSLFNNCTGLENIVIHENVTKIENHAFGWCRSLTNLNIPGGVAEIGTYAFIRCDSLESISVDESNAIYSSDEYGVLFNKQKTELIKYPDNNLRNSYTIPNGVTEICDFAFYNSANLTRITIPDSVISIGNKAFGLTEKLSNLYCGRNVQNIGEDLFESEIIVYGYKNSPMETYATENNLVFVPYESLVTFDANGGTSDVISKKVYTDNVIGELPYPKKDGEAFIGWYTGLTEGDIVTEETVIDDNCTLYARWTDVNSFSVVIPSDKKFYIGDKTNDLGIKLLVDYYDGSPSEVDVGFTVIPSVLDVAGNQTLNIKYAEREVTVNIEVLPVLPVSIDVVKMPIKTTYLKDENFSPKGFEAQITYNNSFKKTVTDISVLDFVSDFYDEGVNIVGFSYTENGNTVSNSFEVTVYNKPMVTADSDTVTAGEIITVPVRISNNCGLMGYNFLVEYDNKVLTPISVEQGDAIVGGMFNDSIGTSNYSRFNVVWSGTTNEKGNGVLFNLVFKVNENAVGESKVELSYIQADTFNEKFDDIKLDVYGTIVTVNNPAFSENTIFSLKDTQVNAGEKLSIPITISNCNNLSEAVICLNYNSEIFEFTDIVSDLLSVQTDVQNSMLIIRMDSLNLDLNNNEIMFVNFKVKEYASGDFDFYLVSNDNTQNITCVGCVVSVSNPFAEKPSRIYGDDISVDVGETITVPIKISNNHGIMGYKFTFKYDSSVLKPINVVMNRNYSGNFADNIGMYSDRFDVVWSGSSNVTDDGDILYLEFEVVGYGDTWIAISYSQGDTFDEYWNDVVLDCQDIKIAVQSNAIITAKPNTSTVVDEYGKYIYGLTGGVKAIDDYISVANGYSYSVSGEIATGAVVNVIKDSDVVDAYTILIFGDVNGDGWYDGMDAVLVSCLANGMLTKDDVSEAVYMAADCNHDGVIDQLDVDLLNEAGALLANVDQSKPTEVLLETSSEYVEYISLIDQSPEIEVEDNSETEVEPNVPESEDTEVEDTLTGDTADSTQQDARVDIFEMILNFIKSLLPYITVPIK